MLAEMMPESGLAGTHRLLTTRASASVRSVDSGLACDPVAEFDTDSNEPDRAIQVEPVQGSHRTGLDRAGVQGRLGKPGSVGARIEGGEPDLDHDADHQAAPARQFLRELPYPPPHLPGDLRRDPD